MSLVTIQLPEALQALIDSRLDTIDRMLLGRVARHDRLEIVKEVESQIYEQVHECDQQEMTREDVLTILASLDPPEAFIPEDFVSEFDSPRTPRTFVMPGTERGRKKKQARLSGILGISTLALGFVLLPIVIVVAQLLESELMVYIGFPATFLLIFAGALAALIVGIRARRGGGWAVVGIVCGVLAMLLFLFGGGLVALELLL